MVPALQETLRGMLPSVRSSRAGPGSIRPGKHPVLPPPLPRRSLLGRDRRGGPAGNSEACEHTQCTSTICDAKLLWQPHQPPTQLPVTQHPRAMTRPSPTFGPIWTGRPVIRAPKSPADVHRRMYRLASMLLHAHGIYNVDVDVYTQPRLIPRAPKPRGTKCHPPHVPKQASPSLECLVSQGVYSSEV